MTDYLDKMNRLENEFQSLRWKADNELAEKGRHCKDEVVYLQQALTVLCEMANSSVGSEKEHYQKRAAEIRSRMRTAINEFDPGYFTRNSTNKNTRTNGSKSSGAKADSSSAKSSDGASDVPDDEVAEWYNHELTHSFDAVSGMEDVKERLLKSVDDCKLTSLKDYLNIQKQKSYLLIGPPGTGKTFIVEALAFELKKMGYKYIKLDSANILSKYVGYAEKVVKRLFAEAQKAPCVVFLDEIDGVCKDRSKPNLPEYASSLTTAFLTGYNEMKHSSTPIIFIGATNYPGDVDRAMLDRVEVISIPLPSKDARIKAFKKVFDGVNKVCLTGGFTYEDIGNLTQKPNGEADHNYRDIERICENIKLAILDKSMEKYGTESAAVAAIKSGEFGISRELYEEVAAKCRPQPKDSILKHLEEWNKLYEDGFMDVDDEEDEAPKSGAETIADSIDALIALLAGVLPAKDASPAGDGE